MNVFISADWEGIAGLVSWYQEKEDNMRARKLMTGEVNAAVEGALAAGASQILVNDSHGSMRNILIEELHPQAQLLSGGLKELSMMAGVQRGMDAAIFIGYHAKAGTTRAILDHTYSGSSVHEWRINGRPAGETTVNAAVAGCYDVPVVLVSGDNSLQEEVETLGAVHVQVKEAFSRYAALNVHPTVAQERIRTAVTKALGQLETFQPFKPSAPVTLELDVPRSSMVEEILLIPGMEQTAARTVAFTHEDFLVAFKAMLAAITLANSVQRG